MLVIYLTNDQKSLCKIWIFRLEVADINDNIPVFPNENINLTISENAIIGQPIRLESATDRDPDFGIDSYQLTGNQKVFELKEERNQDGTIIPSLILKSELDREKTNQYKVISLRLRIISETEFRLQKSELFKKNISADLVKMPNK